MDEHLQESTSNIFKEFFKTLIDVDNGFWATFKGMIRNPGQVIDGYLKEKKYYAPFKYLALSVLVETTTISLVKLFFNTTGENIMMPENHYWDQKTLKLFADYYDNIIPYMDFLFIIPLTLFSFLLFKHHKRTLGIHLIINSYVLAQITFLTFLMSALLPLFKNISLYLLIYPIWIIIATYCYQSFFKGNMVSNIIRGIICIALSLVAFQMLFTLMFPFYASLKG